MRDELAENLLAKVMAWSDEEKARERALLQDLARYKFDEYQQYAPGRRFIESLALWLRQFHDPDRLPVFERRPLARSHSRRCERRSERAKD